VSTGTDALHVASATRGVGRKSSAAVPQSDAVATPPRMLPSGHRINRGLAHRGSCASSRAGCCHATEPRHES